MTSRGVIIDLDGAPEVSPGRDRRRALTLAFAMCLAIASAGLGRDSPGAISERPDSLVICDRSGDRCVPAPAIDSWVMFASQSGGFVQVRTIFDNTLTLPANTTDVQLQVFPDWLANEQLPPAQYTPVRVRTGSGLAVDAVRPGDQRMITWTELGTVYWLYSDKRDIADLIRVANSLR